jgi:hypothetical protein
VLGFTLAVGGAISLARHGKVSVDETTPAPHVKEVR